MASSTVYIASNFLIHDRGPMPKVEELQDTTNIRYDMRNDIVTYDYNPYNWDWYYNYIESARHVFNDNEGKAWVTFMLDAGYVPVIYLPIDTTSQGSTNSIVGGKYTELQKAIMQSKLVYTTMPVTTFRQTRIQSTIMLDYWVHKLDAAKILNQAPETILSEDVIAEVLKYVV